jgi:putative SOS response-associated peptidase YedK
VARWHPPDKSPGVASCTIITTAAKELVQPIHHRMAAILCDPEGWEAWLDPALDNQALPALLEPPTGSPPGPRTPH